VPYGVGRQRRCPEICLADRFRGQWTGAPKGRHSSHSDNDPIDVKFGVIVNVEASRSIRQAQVGASRATIERTKDRFGLKPERLVADTDYRAAWQRRTPVENDHATCSLAAFAVVIWLSLEQRWLA
jgi:hypothetical protein